MAALLTAEAAGDGVEEVTTPGQIDIEYAHIDNCDVTTDMVIVERANEMVGYGRTEWWDSKEGYRTYMVLPPVRPGHEPVVPWIVGWLEARIGEIAAAHPGGEKVFECWAIEPPEGGKPGARKAALESMGYRAVTYGAEMLRPDLGDVPDLPLPDGVEIRPVEETHLRAIWEADVEAFRDHWGFAEPTENEWHKFLDFPYRDESLWKVAWEGDEVAGQVRSFVNPDENRAFGRSRGWTEFVSTRRPWRKQGVAAALIAESLRELAHRGMTEAALGVHVDNPNGAFRLYERLGFRLIHLFGTYQKRLAG
jgi:ribosomal protein S18 acetylase RimI-like enzyme